MKMPLLAALLLCAAPAFPAAPSAPASSATTGSYSKVFANVYVKVAGLKGTLLLNGVESCPFADPGGLPGKTGASVVCNPMKHKIIDGENSLTATFEKAPSGGTPFLEIELADSEDWALVKWNISKETSPKEIRFRFPIAKPMPRVPIEPPPAPKGAKAVKVKPKAGTPPEPDPKLERLEAFCANEIGLLCKSKKTKAKALTECLKNQWDSLLPACRTALRSGD